MINKKIYEIFRIENKNKAKYITIFALFFGVVTLIEVIKIELPVIISILTSVLVFLIYFIIYQLNFKKVMEYYTKKLHKYNCLKKQEYMSFTGQHFNYSGDYVYRFLTNIPVSELKSRKNRLEMALGTNVLDIKFYPKSKTLVQIVTNKKKIDYRQEAKMCKQLNQKILASFKVLNLHIGNIAEVNKEYKDIIYFNSKELPKTLSSKVQDIEHLTKVSGLKLRSSKKFDYEITKSKHVDSVSFGNLLFDKQFKNGKNLIVGVNENSDLIELDVKKIYHSILAGSTGKGKSNMSHVLLSSLIKSDEDIAMLLFDPKKSELKRYRDMVNVRYEGDNNKILDTLKEAVKEMDRRNELIETDKFVNSLETWNKKYKEKMCYIVIFIEEISDLMTSSDKKFQDEFKDLIQRIGQTGRSSGFRCFLSTQYPKVEVLPSMIKANYLTKFGFATGNKIESGVIIDSGDLSDLKKAGEMILKVDGELTKLKVPYLEDKHIEPLVYYLEERHNDTAKKPLSTQFIKSMSPVSNVDITKVEPCHENVTDTQYSIDNCDDLYSFYNEIGEVLSLNKTVERINIGRTKTQALRKELIDSHRLIVSDGKVMLND